MTKHILPVFIPHVGCPHQCVFCDQKAITGQKAPTGREVERILKEGLRLGKNPQIAFYGGSFTAIPAALQEEYLEAAFPYVQQGQAQGVRLYPVCVLRGTPLFAMMERGEYTPLTLEEGVEWSADALEVFQEKEIPVIRLGLNPSRELEEQALAGVYHPALGQLVQSRILRRQCEEILRNAPPGPVTLYYRKGQRSTLQGQKNENLRYFKEHYPDKIVNIEELP